jgi:hypothetical protein
MFFFFFFFENENFYPGGKEVSYPIEIVEIINVNPDHLVITQTGKLANNKRLLCMSNVCVRHLRKMI